MALLQKRMSFFQSVKKVAYATKAFAAAGLDFEKHFAASDENAIGAHVAAAVAAAPVKNNPEHERLLNEAVEENKTVSAKLAAHAAIVTAAGFKVEDCTDEKGLFDAAKFAAANELVIAKAARQMLAKGGHPGVVENVAKDGAKPAANKSVTHAEFQAMTPKAKKEFLRAGGEIQDAPKL
jgi:predicted nucleic acid-binding protein